MRPATRTQGNVVWLVKLACIDGPEEAEAYRNQRLLVRAADRPPLEDDDEIYIQVSSVPPWFKGLGFSNTLSRR